METDQPDNSSDVRKDAPTSRPMFTDAVHMACEQMMLGLKTDVPELSGMICICVWDPALNPRTLPAAILHTKQQMSNGEPILPFRLRAVDQLQRTLGDQLLKIANTISAADAHANQLNEELKAKRAELTKLEEEIASRRQVEGAGDQPADATGGTEAP